MDKTNTGADLHLHSTCSDGLYPPERLVAAGNAAGLSAIALTDHDSTGGLAAAMGAAAGSNLEIIPGVEFSIQAGMDEVHVVGLFIRPDAPELVAALGAYIRDREERVREICRRLAELDVTIAAENVLREAGGGAPTRVHVARALRDKGYVRTIGEAFDRYLGNHAPAYVPKPRPPAERAIALIHGAGGIAVMAHPGLTGRDDLIPSLVAARLDALEVYVPAHDSAQVGRYRAMAEQYGMLESGGTDFHGDTREGLAVGSVRLPEEQLQLLRERANCYR